MTNIPAGSPHYRAAVENRYAGDARFTEATLAVAYELRTANLIAFENIASVDMTDWPAEAQDLWFKRRAAIIERLDLA